MATYVYGTTTNHWRAYMAYTTSETDTTYTIAVSEAGMQSVSWGFALSSGVSVTVTCTGKSSLSGSGGFSSSTGATVTQSYTSGSFAITKTTSAQTITVATTTTNASGYMNGTSTATATFTVPALATYTVAYDANGGSGAPSSQTKTYGVALTLSSTKPTRTGYTFQGWATSSTGSVAYSAGGSYTANAAVTLYAVWKVDTYTVAYNANGGSGAPSSQTKTYGVALTLSSTEPTRTGYTFSGWNTDSSGTGTSYAAGGTYSTNASVTLYAQWTVNTYYLDVNGYLDGSNVSSTADYGTFTMTANGTTTTGLYDYYQKIPYGSTYSITNIAALSGKKYIGITTDSAALSGTMGTSAIAVRLVFHSTYTVTYDMNGGTGGPSNQTKEWGTDLTLSSTKPTRDYYTFQGWGTSSTATDVAYSAGGTYSTNASITLYAIWKEDTPPVYYYDANGKYYKGRAYYYNSSGNYYLAQAIYYFDSSGNYKRII